MVQDLCLVCLLSVRPERSWLEPGERVRTAAGRAGLPAPFYKRFSPPVRRFSGRGSAGLILGLKEQVLYTGLISMRIGIDAHIILRQHKRYDPKIARYTEELIMNLIDADKKKEHTWVLFFDKRMKSTKKFARSNVVIKRFPFIQYRRYLPVVYSHMLISSFLAAARLDVFHSPEGLIPYLYPGRIVTTFHYVPRGKSESNLFVRSFMLGTRVAFSRLCKRAKRIIVGSSEDKKTLTKRHGYPESRVVVMPLEGSDRGAWKRRVKKLTKVYQEMVQKEPSPAGGLANKERKEETVRRGKA